MSHNFIFTSRDKERLVKLMIERLCNAVSFDSWSFLMSEDRRSDWRCH